MKIRMSVGRCCCGPGGPLCSPGETAWFDDFTSYSAGENLSPYGYSGNCNNPIENNTGIRPRGSIFCPYTTTADRGYPFNYELQSRIYFQAEINTSIEDGILFINNSRAAGNISPNIYWDLPGSELVAGWVTAGQTQDTSTTAQAISDGDTVAILYEVQSYDDDGTDCQITATVTFFFNDVEFEQQTDNLSLPRGQWCGRTYGIAGGAADTTNWNFSIDFSISYGENWLDLDTSTPVTAMVTRSGGSAPFTYTVLAGSLPSGLSLDSSTGTISGTPDTSPDNGTFRIRCTDDNGNTADTVTYTYSVAIGA